MTDAGGRVERRHVALHEAGHLVAQVVLGFEVEYGSIRAGRGFLGLAVPVARPIEDADRLSLYPTLLQPPALRDDVERRIICSLAGSLAETYLADEAPRARFDDEAAERIARAALTELGPRLAELVVEHEQRTESTPDETSAFRLAGAIVGPDSVGLYLELLRNEAQALVLRYRAAILRVADALERHAVLRGDHVAALVEGRPAVKIPRLRGPKVDSRADYICIDSHVSASGTYLEGDVRRGSHEDVRAHPGLWMRADLPREERFMRRREYEQAASTPPPTESLGPTSGGLPIRLRGPIPPERRMRCTRGLSFGGAGGVAMYFVGEVYDLADPLVAKYPDHFEPAGPDPAA